MSGMWIEIELFNGEKAVLDSTQIALVSEATGIRGEGETIYDYEVWSHGRRILVTEEQFKSLCGLMWTGHAAANIVTTSGQITMT